MKEIIFDKQKEIGILYTFKVIKEKIQNLWAIDGKDRNQREGQ